MHMDAFGRFIYVLERAKKITSELPDRCGEE